VSVNRRTYEQARRQAPRNLQTSPRRVHNLLRSSIRAGLITGGSPLKEDALVSSLSASRNSVRAALQMLVQEGLVERRAHHGTKVVAEILQVPLDQLVPPVAFENGRGAVEELDHRQVPASGYVRERLEIDDDVVDVSEVLISLDGEAMSLRVSYIPLGTRPVRRIAEVVPVALAFQQVFGVALGASEASVEAVAASGRASRLLGVPDGAPVLMQEVLLRDCDGVPRELSYTQYRGGRVSLAVQAPEVAVNLPSGSPGPRSGGVIGP
jgi:GntR family transcriptional regulator